MPSDTQFALEILASFPTVPEPCVISARHSRECTIGAPPTRSHVRRSRQRFVVSVRLAYCMCCWRRRTKSTINCRRALSLSAVTVERGCAPGDDSVSNVSSRQGVTCAVVPRVGAYTPLNAAAAPSREAVHRVMTPSNVDSRHGVTFTDLTNPNPCSIYLTSREAAHWVITPSNVASRLGVTCTVVPRVSAQGEDVLEC